MKLTLILLSLLALLALIALFVMAKNSHTAPALGLSHAKFVPCKYATNCVSSMSEGDTFIAPFAGDALNVWQQLPAVIQAAGGEVQQQRDDYLWATFTTRWFGFVDDVELALDSQAGVVHVRSASRVGRSDFGVNRQRIELLRARLLTQASH